MRCAAILLVLALGTAGCTQDRNKAASGSSGGGTVIQYDCIPNYANWGGVTALYKQKTGVTVPPDPKGSSVALAALAKEKDAPRADCAYYSGAIGVAAARKGLHEAYRPARWEGVPPGLKDAEGLWWTVHTGTVALVINTQALGSAPLPRSWDDLLKPEYKGKVTYDDPTWGGTSYTFIYGINLLKGGDAKNFKPGLAYLKALDRNVTRYPRESVYNDVLRGEVAIWINADGNGYKMKWTDKGPIEVVIPEEGSVSMPLVMGLVRGAPHREAAQRYLDWLLTDEAQAEFARSFFRPVIASALPAELRDKFLPPAAYARVKDLALPEMADSADAFKKQWLDEIGHGR
ncbi:MAG TPA: extracellular solute-binding protein [Pseudomonadota bacterium]|nr:extracellular solute-binding protein [Pseudomonadota bacterium]